MGGVYDYGGSTTTVFTVVHSSNAELNFLLSFDDNNTQARLQNSNADATKKNLLNLLVILA